MGGETHPNFQREKFSKLPMKEACDFCGVEYEAVPRAFCHGMHCGRKRCVDLCEECRDWIEAVTECAPALNGEKPEAKEVTI